MMLMEGMTPNCRQVCRLASECLERPLSPWMRVKLWVHFKMCRVCEIYAQQLKDLHDNLARGGEDFRSDETLSPEARERIRAQLKAESGGG